MDFTIFLKDKFLAQKITVKEMLSSYDKDGGYSDGLFSREEVMEIVRDSVEPLFARFFGKKNMVNSIFKYVDKDTGKGKDGYISYEEIEKYLKETYDLKLSEIEPMTIKQACRWVTFAHERKKKENKNN